MAGNFQDDDREEDMRALFGMYKDEAEGRSGIDAFLKLDGKDIQFELKTTSKGSVTTVRDFGPDHIEKWKDKHWLIGFFVDGEEYYHYGSPAMMAGWSLSKPCSRPRAKVTRVSVGLNQTDSNPHRVCLKNWMSIKVGNLRPRRCWASGWILYW